MSYHHLSIFERGRIQELSSLGYSHREIGKRLHRHHSCIGRELGRNASITSYAGEAAQMAYHARRTRPKGTCTDTLVSILTDKLRLTWSPEQIANTATLGIVRFKTIYNWLYSGALDTITTQSLRQKGTRRKPEKHGKFSMGTPISNRPEDVKGRATFGHWELDSMVSSRGKSKDCFATFVERKSRLYTAFKTADRTASSMHAAITMLYNMLPKGAFQTGTTDRGKEFACHTAIKQQLGLTLYFADAYASWQRGSHENSNGLLREFFPKKTDLALVHQEQLTYNLFLVNARPRKCLAWKSPIEVFLHEVAHLT